MRLSVNGHILHEPAFRAEWMRLSNGLEMDAPYAAGMAPAQLQRLAVRNLVQPPKACALRPKRRMRSGFADGVTTPTRSAERVCATPSWKTYWCSERASADITRHVPRPGRATCEDFYRRNGTLYDFPEAVRTQHIVCNVHTAAGANRAEATMKLAAERLAAGIAFSRVTDQYSDCKGVGGSLGWVSRGEMVAAFEDVVFASPVGTHSKVFRSVFGLHIAHVSEHRSAGRTPFEKVHLEIASRLHQEARGAFLAQALLQMERTSQIFVMEEEEHA